MQNREKYHFSVQIIENFLIYKFRSLNEYSAFLLSFNYSHYDRSFNDDAIFLLKLIENNKVSQDIIDQIIEFQIANL